MLFTSDPQYFCINFEKWNTRFTQDTRINQFDLTGRTQYKNMNTKNKGINNANFITTYKEFTDYIKKNDEENDKQNYNLIMNYLYSSKVTLDKNINDFLNSEKTSEDYTIYEEQLYQVFERLLVVKNRAGIYLRSTFIKLLREMITAKYYEYGDRLSEGEIKNPELYIGDELMIDLYILGYIQRLLIPFVSHWISVFKDNRDKNENDDPLNTVLVRIWTKVLSLSFSKANRERIENKIRKKITAVVVLREMRNPQFFRLWSKQGFDKNNMVLIAYEDFMFRSLFKIMLAPGEKSKGLGFVDAVINNRVNLIFGDRIKEGEEIHTMLMNSGSGDSARRESAETAHYDDNEEYGYLDRGIDEFTIDDRVESLFRLDDGIFDGLRGKTIEQVIHGTSKMSLMHKLDISEDKIFDISDHEFKKTRLHNYVLNIVLGSIMDLSLLQSGLKATEFNKSMRYIYTFLDKNGYNSLLNVLMNSDLADVTKFVSTSKQETLMMNMKESQLHLILRQIYSTQLSFNDRDKIFDYVVRICGGVGENQLKRYIVDVEERYEDERIDLLDLANDLMKLIITFSR